MRKIRTTAPGKNKKLSSVLAVAVSAVCLAVGMLQMPMAVYADEMTPEQLAQELAKMEEEARVAQQAREQAAQNAAVLEAQAKAQQEEQSELYLKWGAYAANDYTYTTDVANYLSGNNSAAATQSAAAAAGTLSQYKMPNIPNVSKVNPKANGVNTVDLVIFSGQSNMSGTGGNASQAPAVIKGYEFRAASDPTGLYPISEPFGVRETGYMGESAVVKQGSLVSAFANAYYRKTGTPIVAVSASRGGTNSAYWATSEVRADLYSRFVKANDYLTKNGYTVRHKYLVWLQGESDSNGLTTADQYQKNLEAAFSSLFANGLEQVFIITPGYAQGGVIFYDDVINAQKNLAAKSNRYTICSELLRTLPANSTYMSDAVHYNQKALNMVGADAANHVAAGY